QLRWLEQPAQENQQQLRCFTAPSIRSQVRLKLTERISANSSFRHCAETSVWFSRRHCCSTVRLPRTCWLGSPMRPMRRFSMQSNVRRRWNSSSENQQVLAIVLASVAAHFPVANANDYRLHARF